MGHIKTKANATRESSDWSLARLGHAAAALCCLCFFFGSGCAFPVDGSVPTAEELAVVPAGPGAALVIRNNSARTICYVNFSPAASSSWGEDQLGPSETIPPGGLRGWRVPDNTYDLRVLDCNRTPLADDRGVFVGGEGAAVTYQ